MICPSESSIERVKVSHVIVECRVINHHPVLLYVFYCYEVCTPRGGYLAGSVLYTHRALISNRVSVDIRCIPLITIPLITIPLIFRRASRANSGIQRISMYLQLLFRVPRERERERESLSEIERSVLYTHRASISNYVSAVIVSREAISDRRSVLNTHRASMSNLNHLLASRFHMPILNYTSTADI